MVYVFSFFDEKNTKKMPLATFEYPVCGFLYPLSIGKKKIIDTHVSIWTVVKEKHLRCTAQSQAT